MRRGEKMYKCTECGTLFEEGEEAVWQESRGEFWGMPCSETMRGCPECRGDYEKAFKCQKCEGWCFEDELVDGLCQECQEEILYRES